MKRVEPVYPNLAAWRKEMGLSQRDAARILGVTQTFYSRMERGRRMVTGPQAKFVMRVTRVPLEALVGLA